MNPHLSQKMVVVVKIGGLGGEGGSRQGGKGKEIRKQEVGGGRERKQGN